MIGSFCFPGFDFAQQVMQTTKNYLRSSQTMTTKESTNAFLAKGSQELGIGSWSTRILKLGSKQKDLPRYGA
jgi:hypothetical protein